MEERRNLHAELSNSDKLTDDEKAIQTRHAGCFQKSIQIVNELVEEHINTSTDTSRGWIACSEGLPDESGEYLTFVEYEGRKFIAIDDIDCDGTFKKWNCTSNYHIIAWQLFPNIPFV